LRTNTLNAYYGDVTHNVPDEGIISVAEGGGWRAEKTGIVDAGSQHDPFNVDYRIIAMHRLG